MTAAAKSMLSGSSSQVEKIGMDSKIGFPSVEFELTDARGELHSSKRYMGSWLLLVFHRHLG